MEKQPERVKQARRFVSTVLIPMLQEYAAMDVVASPLVSELLREFCADDVLDASSSPDIEDVYAYLDSRMEIHDEKKPWEDEKLLRSAWFKTLLESRTYRLEDAIELIQKVQNKPV